MGKLWKCAAVSLLLAALLTALPAAVQSPAAASGESAASTARADRLASLHLFRGVGVREDGSLIYSLNSNSTRLQGLIMLLRLLGQEDAALAVKEASPFSDVSGQGAAYTAYAYQRGITNGTSETTFTPGGPLSARAYGAFLLRALGYTEAEGDFTWGGQLSLSASLGMLSESAARAMDEITLNRGDMVDLSYAALTCRLKGEERTLAEKLCQEGVFTREEGEAAGVLGADAGWTCSYYSPYDNGDTVSYSRKKIPTSTRSVEASVVTVNMTNPAVKVKSALVDNTLGVTAPFTKIVEQSGAAVVINGNFFSSYSAFQAPIGHVMTDGEFRYGNSGLSSLGITRTGELRIGRPAVFVRLTAENGGSKSTWAIYEINTADQRDDTSILYTPSYGKSVTISRDSWAMVIRNNVIRDYYYITQNASISIPEDGCVVWMGVGFASTDYFRIPQEGSTVTMEPYLNKKDEQGFTLDGVESIISGAPRLVQNGVAVMTLEDGFTEARFTTQSAPRTAVGVNRAGRLVLVCVPDGATIQQMREVMLSLDCVDAINLDGGASCAMYCLGNYIKKAERELTVTLQVFVQP